MLGRSNDLWSRGSSAEDAMKLNVAKGESEPVYHANLYLEAAKRVIFENCLGACEL